MNTEPDRKLVKRFLNGDEEAFHMLMSRYQKPLYYFVYRIVGDHDETADICQNTFVQVFMKCSGFMWRSSFKTWLYRIATNQSLNHMRGITRTVSLSEEHTDGLVSGAPETGVEGYALRRKIASLPEKQRLALILRFYGDMSFKEIASVIGCTVGTAKVNCHHAINALRKGMRGYDGLQEGA